MRRKYRSTTASRSSFAGCGLSPSPRSPVKAMCGIAGAVSTAGAPVERATAALIHRGPDEGGIWCSPGRSAVLGHRRLAVIDVARGHQPLTGEDGSVRVLLNGEIYNFRELRAELERRGHRFSTGSDA